MSTTRTSEHIVSVERVTAVKGCEYADPRIFAVVERLGSHVKVCAVSNHYRDFPVALVPSGQTRWQVMQDLAWAGAKSYGARYVETPHPDDEPLTSCALRADLPGRHRADYDLTVDVAQIGEPTSARHTIPTTTTSRSAA